MNPRAFVVLVYVITFFLSIGGIISIPADAWKYIAFWQQTLFAFYILVGFCGFLIAFWVYEDGEELNRLGVEKYLLWKQVQDLENKMKKAT